MKKLTKSQVIAIAKKSPFNNCMVDLYPSNCSPANQTWVKPLTVEVHWHEGQAVKLYVDGSYKTFDSIINEFQYYNCNSELGNRVHFYELS